MRRQLKLRWDLSRLMRGSEALPTSRKGTVMLCSGIKKVQNASVMFRWKGVYWKTIYEESLEQSGKRHFGLFTPRALGGLSALGLVLWLTWPGHHFLSALSEGRVHLVTPATPGSACLVCPQAFLRGSSPSQPLLAGLPYFPPGLWMACTNGEIEREVWNLDFSQKVWETRQPWAHLCPEKHRGQPVQCPAFPVMVPSACFLHLYALPEGI